MNSGKTKYIHAGRRFAAFAAVLALLFSGLVAAWHFEAPLADLGSANPTLSAGIGVDVLETVTAEGTKPATPVNKADQDCAFHCDQHGRGLPPVAVMAANSLPSPPRLLNLRDAPKAATQPDGLLEPPRA